MMCSKLCLSQVIYVVLMLRGLDVAQAIQSSKSKLGIMKPSSQLKIGHEVKANQMDHTFLVGGVASRIYKHPYAASIMKDNEYVCGAAVLNKLWVLTHLFCVANNTSMQFLFKSYLNHLSVRVGSSFNSKGGTIHQVKLIKINKDHGFAAIKLSTPIEMNNRVKAINLPETKMLNLRTTVEVSGWTVNGHIRMVKMPILDSYLCNKDKSLKLTALKRDKYICMGGIDDLPYGQNNVCRRDSGNPIAQNGYLLSLVPFSKECTQYKMVQFYPIVYSVIKWLDSVIWENEKKANYWNKPQEFIQLGENYTTTKSVLKTKNTENTTSTTTRPWPRYIEAKPGRSLYEAYLKSVQPQSMPQSQENTVLNLHLYLNAPAMPTDQWAKRYSQGMKKLQNNDFTETNRVATTKYDNLNQLEKRRDFYNRNFG